MHYIWAKLESYGLQQLMKQQFTMLTRQEYDLTTPRVLSDTFTFCLDAVFV